jgi:glycosyltransferase involved in cell wall biosynthesis
MEEESGGAAPSVSVILPAYNRGGYLCEAIRSVVAQTFTDWELVVVDDGSHEDFSWVPATDPRVSLIRQINLGVSVARNRGIAVSRGRFIAFLDDDDQWRPTKLERQVELLRAGSVFCHTGWDIIDGEGARIGPGWARKASYLDFLASPGGIATSSSMIDRTVLERVGLFDPVFRQGQDCDFFLRVMRSYSVSYVPTVEVDVRHHAGNRSKNYWPSHQVLRSLYAREAKLASFRNDTAVAQAIRQGEHRARRNCAFVAIDAARSAARTHSVMSTARHLVRATKLSPRVVQESCGAFVKTRLSR